ncbi:Peptidoglycan/LPS O-acetylase OafA/YrhL, contains acyltransferase and SGNH-hydrolase domains [Pseudobutyrivibrio sp. UC1225]|uniref:acyltransferase family protein n=1 Tax=Pseudobutyrivibrio sp. UC1225 TaxID=1798185 RepID=UPI0008E042F4|nr:acyltransferase family protein [Pseudobutyrivibrio sp. UC1225]SFO26814.1 Peptidoglycan/LPS O-acetylase OafA/YrhL, contains acyltransferase and SGNH-hydrolase domains [Pseudobutyrivibrio sp. UC1225]
MTDIIMLLLVLFMIYIMAGKAKLDETGEHFFDKKNSNAMRGFWCLVVILVHIPATYGNRIQDLISSFGYIGVTFFFMTSAYGLSLSMEKKPDNIKSFWKRRLPKLVITCWVINIMYAIIFLLIGGSSTGFFSLLKIDLWVRWLLACYLFFWVAHIVFKKNKIICNFLIFTLVIAFSFIFYYMHSMGGYTKTVWSTECYGFIWGILLAWFYSQIYQFFKDKWMIKLVVSCGVSLFFGISYLMFKPVPFFGDYLLKIILGFSITLFIIISNVKISYGNKVNQFLGSISFEIYLLHGMVFGLVEKLSNNLLSSGMFILVSIVVTIVFAMVTHILAIRIMNRVNKILL